MKIFVYWFPIALLLIAQISGIGRAEPNSLTTPQIAWSKVCTVLKPSPFMVGASFAYWAKFAQIFSIAPAPNGSCYVSGTLRGDATWDGKPVESETETSPRFLAYFSADGELRWFHRIESGTFNLASDEVGNAVLVGEVGLGTNIVKTSIQGMMVVAKVNPNGKTLWIKNVPTRGASFLSPDCLAISKSHDLIIGGIFSGRLTVGSNTIAVTDNQQSGDLFVARFDPNGSEKSVVAISGEGRKALNSLAIDDENGVLVTGEFTGALDFGITNFVCRGKSDIFAAKLSADGKWIWALAAGGKSFDSGQSIAVDGEGNCFLTGIFCDEAELGGLTIKSTANGDMFLCKLNPVGRLIWLRHFGQYGFASGFNLVASPDGLTFFTAYHDRNDTSFGGSKLQDKTCLLGGCDTNGNLIWIKPLNYSSGEEKILLARDLRGNLFFDGEFSETNKVSDVHGQRSMVLSKLNFP